VSEPIDLDALLRSFKAGDDQRGSLLGIGAALDPNRALHGLMDSFAQDQAELERVSHEVAEQRDQKERAAIAREQAMLEEIAAMRKLAHRAEERATEGESRQRFMVKLTTASVIVAVLSLAVAIWG